MNLKNGKRLFNLFIWIWNIFKYMSHLEMYRNILYEKYNFKKQDTKYFNIKGHDYD